MAARLSDRSKRSSFKGGPGAGPDREPEPSFGKEEWWEAELEEEEEESVTERLGGTSCFDDGEFGPEDGGGEGPDSDSDYFSGESVEEGPSSTDASPVGVSPVGHAPSSMSTRQLQDGWRILRGAGSASHRRQTDDSSFEVTDASVVTDGASKYVVSPAAAASAPPRRADDAQSVSSPQLYTIHVIRSGGSDKTPAVITRRYSDFQRLHATSRRNHGDQMERVSFPRKKSRRNFTAETIAKRSRAFEQYSSHSCSLPVSQGAPSVRQFFYSSDSQAGQSLIRAGRFQEALGPSSNAKRSQDKLGWASYHDNESESPPTASSHWLYTLVGSSSCFQEVEQSEEARENCDHALRSSLAAEARAGSDDRPLPPQDRPLPPQPRSSSSPSSQAVIRSSWQTGRDKQRWEEHSQRWEGQGAGPDDQVTVRDFSVQHRSQDSEGDG